MPDNLKTTKESQKETLQQLYHCGQAIDWSDFK